MKQKFYSRVLVVPSIPDGCWHWTAAINNRGYGSMRDGDKPRGAHVVSWEIANGPVPAGMVIDHMCWNRSCVNPGHLRAVTQSQNLQNVSVLSSRNSSGYRGVSYDASRNKYMACVRTNGKTYNLGRYSTAEEAGEAARLGRLRMFTHNELDKESSGA